MRTRSPDGEAVLLVHHLCAPLPWYIITEIGWPLVSDHMRNPVRILLQTTIAPIEDDWSIDRFSLLQEHLSSITDDQGNVLYEVTARNRETDGEGNDGLLSRLDHTDFNQLWLFAVDTGDGLTVADCEGIRAIHTPNF